MRDSDSLERIVHDKYVFCTRDNQDKLRPIIGPKYLQNGRFTNCFKCKIIKKRE